MHDGAADLLREARWTAQVRPFQRSARYCAPPAVNAHTSLGDVAPAATTTSLLFPGNVTCVQVDPLRRHAVGAGAWLNAQPPSADRVTV